MHTFSRVIVAIVALGCVALAYAFSARGGFPQPIPALGWFRITDIDEGMTGGKLLETPGGKIAIVEVAYQGPKEWAEVVVENWEGPTLVSTETIMRMKFGTDTLVRHEWGTQGAVGPPFSHQREIYSIWLDPLPETLADGRNAIGKVVVGDPNEPNIAHPRGAIINVRAYGERREFGSEWRPDMSPSLRESRVMPDSQPIVIWQSSVYSDKDAGREPPYPEGTAVSRMLFRLVEK